MTISNDLIAAYVGYNEDEWKAEYEAWYRAALHDENIDADELNEQCENWYKNKAARTIRSHTARQRLEVYLEWNGIIGYTGRIYEIATGEL